ncbi:MAG: hypothetical protein EPO02_14085, partial [Nitrospirae bacterium]
MPCSGTSQIYPNQPVGNYTLASTLGSAGSLYTLKNVESPQIANKEKDSGASALAENNIFSSDFWKTQLIKLAEAITVGPCAIGSTDCPLYLASAGNVIFNIIWDPLATINVSPANISISDTSPSAAVSVRNNGAAGSVLNWSASSNVGWLSVTPASGTVTQGGVSAATVTYTGGLAQSATPYPATVAFTGTSQTSNPPGRIAAGSPQSVAVTLSVPPPSLLCSPAVHPTVAINQNASFSASPSGVSYSWSAPPDGNPASGAAQNFSVKYPTAGTKTVSVASGAASSSCSVNVINLSCTFTASPSTILPLGQSTLSWRCQNANSCSISPGVGPVNPVSSSTQVSPSSTT